MGSKHSTSACFAFNKDQSVALCFAPTDLELAEVVHVEELFDIVEQSSVVVQQRAFHVGIPPPHIINVVDQCGVPHLHVANVYLPKVIVARSMPASTCERNEGNGSC